MYIQLEQANLKAVIADFLACRSVCLTQGNERTVGKELWGFCLF